MARKLGSKHKLCRRVGEKLCAAKKCPVMRRPTPAGMHGSKGKRKLTEYGLQLQEKQKAKFIYGVLERQFKRYYANAVRKPGDTSIYLSETLERRLDNVLYRVGLTKTRASARQAIVHGHVFVNDHRVDRPSYGVAMNDAIRCGQPVTREEREVPAWLSFDAEEGTVKVLGKPSVADLPERLKWRLIIEFCSR